MAEPVVAMQMYTLRNEAAEDYPGTLREVADMGYKAVQVSGTHSYSAAEIRNVMDDLGLGSAGTHVGFAMMRDDFNAAVDLVKTLNTPYAIVPSCPGEYREDSQGWMRFAREMNEVAARMKEEGLVLGYHNHSFEFKDYGGKTGYDILWEIASDDIQPEIDTYWVRHGDHDPVAMLKRFAGRIDVVHFKDMGEGEGKPMVPVGDGILDWPAILEACRTGGAKWLDIEQDRCEPLAPLDAARKSLDNCRKWGLA
ncbi:MAG: sugar phosphate isomerase/epimerase [Planctomycetes bacterium]|nr:sugar phosphate isomerase/epimerase [Planctomycetota bacterium]